MMYQEGQLLRFSSFIFKNGNTPKPKYFVVLRHINDMVMMVTLPTSKDHIPTDVNVTHGCVNLPERCVNAYVLSPYDQVTPSFRFAVPTYIYGEDVDEYDEAYLDTMEAEVEDLGILSNDLLQEIRDCVKQATGIKQKYVRLL